MQTNDKPQKNEKTKEDLRAYRVKGRITILQLMAGLAILGVLLAWVLHAFLVS